MQVHFVNNGKAGNPYDRYIQNTAGTGAAGCGDFARAAPAAGHQACQCAASNGDGRQLVCDSGSAATAGRAERSVNDAESRSSVAARRGAMRGKRYPGGISAAADSDDGGTPGRDFCRGGAGQRESRKQDEIEQAVPHKLKGRWMR